MRKTLSLSAFIVSPRALAIPSLPFLSRLQFLTIKSRSSGGRASRHFFMHSRRCSSNSLSDSGEDNCSSSCSHSLLGSFQCSSSTNRATPQENLNMSSISRPSSTFLATRLIVSSPSSAGIRQPLRSKKYISLARSFSYSSPASTESALSRASNREKDSSLKSRIFIQNYAVKGPIKYLRVRQRLSAAGQLR